MLQRTPSLRRRALRTRARLDGRLLSACLNAAVDVRTVTMKQGSSQNSGSHMGMPRCILGSARWPLGLVVTEHRSSAGSGHATSASEGTGSMTGSSFIFS